MGTRARININDNGKILVSIYTQFDGYPSGLGATLAKFSTDMRVVNGLPIGIIEEKLANGLGCFAAQLIALLKEKPGNVYIRSTSSASHGEEFIYTLSAKGENIWVTVKHVSFEDEEESMETIYDGFARDFSEYLKLNPNLY